jgi:hypothetical protein
MNYCHRFSHHAKLVCFFALASCFFLPTFAAENKAKFHLPPSAKLSYFIRADIKGLNIEGSGLIEWDKSADKFTISSETRTPLTGILIAEKSEGLIESTGLAPEIFSIKRFRKELITTRLDRKNRQIHYQGNATPSSLEGGEQDRLSVVWQLVSLARTTPTKFSTGSKHKFIVVGPHDSDAWLFNVKKTQRIQTSLGEVDAIQITRLPSESPDAQSMEIWLAPSLDWYPVKIRLSEKNGDYVEQSLEKIEKK